MKNILVLILLFVSMSLLCQPRLFNSILSEQSSITFSNNIKENKETNIISYDYLYNGAGIGVGDFNHDGMADLFFAGNMVADQLYLNQGRFQFTNETEAGGINSNGWSTGVCVFDVNADGWDDIYVCRSGPQSYDAGRRNVLYENQGDGTFKENAAKYGLDLQGYYTQATPLDIDLDGDLDLYVMGHPGKFQHKADFQSLIKDIESGNIESDVLLENVGGSFIEITKEAGIIEYGYGLGLAITDINRDGYPDILVCNDFDEPDHLFVNQQNNTFKDENLRYFKHTSNYSMGNDVGDINNDGFLDFISVDMAFQDHKRSKTNMASMDPNKFYARVQLGWGYQYMHNMLQLNTGLGSFQEVAQYSGIAKTDWSWAPLFCDFDMDGLQDLFISNGYKRDTKNNDIGYLLKLAQAKQGDLSIKEFLALIPSVKIENYFYKNKDGLKFEDKRIDWGVNEKLNTNGAAYADLDLDGDLDLILNNIDTLASVYENTSARAESSLIFHLDRVSQSRLAGIIFEAIMEDGSQYKEAYFVRGYASTVEKKIFFYSDESNRFVSAVLHLPNGKKIKIALSNSPRNEIKLRADLGYPEMNAEPIPEQLFFREVTADFRLDAVYLENKFNDFERESLLPHMMSSLGPNICVGDLNKDSLEDFVVTSAIGKIPTVFLQNPNSTFKKILSRSFYNHHSTEDADVHIFDVNGDNSNDLFITSGGSQWEEGDTALQNRLYIGNGLGLFGWVKNGTPKMERTNSGKIVANDIDGDGDIDFLICGKGKTGKYPYAGNTKIYMNEQGFFKDRTAIIAPDIEGLGMVNDACFSDMDSDGDLDILLVGEWMNIEWMENRNGVFKRLPSKVDLTGWWTCIIPVDIDGDGDDDYVLGNAGLNNKFKASRENPLEVYANDFDNNGTLDIVLSYEKENFKVPVRGMECSSAQMPFILDKFATFVSFASSNLAEIYGQEKLDQSLHYKANEFRSGILYNNGSEGMEFLAFPDETQLSYINAFQVIDVNDDGKLDVIGVGNRYNTEVETTRNDAGCGVVMLQSEDGSFINIPPRVSGFYAPFNAKSIEIIHLGKDQRLGLVVGNNNNRLQLFILK
jgi:enediyne biosynthesis protein E4